MDVTCCCTTGPLATGGSTISSLPPLTPNAWLRHDYIIEAFDSAAPHSVLEFGTGQGAMGSRLAARCQTYVGIEPDEQSRAVAQRRLGGVGRGEILASVAQLSRGAKFDAVCAFEVLEHIEDDAVTLAEWRRHLNDDGWLILSVPAWQRQFGQGDITAGHFRRYDPEMLRRVVEQSGFRVHSLEVYGFPLGYVLQTVRNMIAWRRNRQLAAASTLEERTGGSGRLLQPPDWMARVIELGVLPFRRLQRRFRRESLGTGIVLAAQRVNSAG